MQIDCERTRSAGRHIFASVDEFTGEVKLKKITVVSDAGTVINPTSYEGQIDGGVMLGIGHTLMEQIKIEDGRPITTTFGDYKIPTASEMPRLEIAWVQDSEPTGPFGAKGLGEPVMVPVAPAIANAIYHATGVRLTQLPFTAEKVLAALRASEKTGG